MSVGRTWVLAAACLAAWVGAGCGGAPGGPDAAAAIATVATVTGVTGGADVLAEPPARVIFATRTGEVAVEVEVAATDEARRKGLMFRKSLAPGKGMLFLMGVDRVQSFWMRNTVIALDMIFVDRSMRVVGVAAEAEPLTETPRFVAAPSRYVVEVPGGYAARAGIATGDAVRFERVPASP